MRGEGSRLQVCLFSFDSDFLSFPFLTETERCPQFKATVRPSQPFTRISRTGLLCPFLRTWASFLILFLLARPRIPQLAPSGSLPKVLEALAKPPFEPLTEASRLHRSVNTVFLVAVASSQRCSTLNALRVSPGHLRFDRLGVHLVPSPPFIAKNQSASSGSIEICLLLLCS